MKIDIDTLRTLAVAGIKFYAPFQSPGGGKTLELRPDEIRAFVEDPENFIAEKMGVTKSEYLAWVETDGTPRCGATTSQGARCKNVVSGGIQYPIQDWVRLDGDYCAVHGGESSEEAKEKRRRSGRSPE